MVSDSRWLPARDFDGDGYLDWARAGDWAGLFGSGVEPWLPLLVERRAELSWEQMLKRAEALELRLPSAWSAGARIAPLWARRDQLENLLALGWAAVEFAQPLAAGSLQAPASPRAAPAGSPSPKVVVGVIDIGGAPLNRAFRRSAGADAPTRLLSYWEQGRPVRGLHWRTPALGYGRELDASALQQLVQRAGSAAEERALYAGELDMAERVWAAELGLVDHASHVLDTVAGLSLAQALPGSAKPATPDPAAEAALVLVSLAGGLPGQGTGAPSSVQLLDGLRHVLAVAQQHAPGATVIVNISLGIQAGPRDGSLLLVRAIDELMEANPQLLVIFAAGNQGRDAMVASGELVASAAGTAGAELRWRIRPEDPTDSFLEAWWPAAYADLPRFRVRTPEGQACAWLGAGQQQELQRDGRALARLSLTRAGRLWLALAPVQAEPRGGVPAGCWTLECSSAQALPLWVMVQGDQPDFSLLPGVSRGQSYLESARGLELHADGAMNALSTGRYPIIVGAGSLENQRAAWYSAAVGSPQPRPGAVHLLAAADEAMLTPGLLATGVLSGTYVRMRGTSVAAPVASRQIVNSVAQGLRASEAAGWRQALGLLQTAMPLPTLRPDQPARFASSLNSAS